MICSLGALFSHIKLQLVCEVEMPSLCGLWSCPKRVKQIYVATFVRFVGFSFCKFDVHMFLCKVCFEFCIVSLSDCLDVWCLDWSSWFVFFVFVFCKFEYQHVSMSLCRLETYAFLATSEEMNTGMFLIVESGFCWNALVHKFNQVYGHDFNLTRTLAIQFALNQDRSKPLSLATWSLSSLTWTF